MATVRVGSQQIDVSHILETAAWHVLIVISLVLFGILMSRFRKLRSHKVPLPIRVRILHVVGLQVSLTLGSLDPNHIFFTWAKFVTMISYGLFSILGTNLILYYFFSHAEAYLIANSMLTVPAWLVYLRNAWMAFDLVGGSILLTVSLALEILWLEGLPYVFMGAQLLLLGPVLVAIVLHVSRQLQYLYSSVASTGSTTASVHKDIKSFRRYGLLSAAVTAGFGIVLTVSFVPSLQIDKSLTFAELPGYYNTIGNDRWTFDEWPKWTAMAGLFYVLKLHWISKDPTSFLSKHIHAERKSTDDLPTSLVPGNTITNTNPSEVVVGAFDVPTRPDSPPLRKQSPAALLRLQSTKTMCKTIDGRRYSTQSRLNDVPPPARSTYHISEHSRSLESRRSCSSNSSVSAASTKPSLERDQLRVYAPPIVNIMHEPQNSRPDTNYNSHSSVRSTSISSRSPPASAGGMNSAAPSLSSFHSDIMSTSSSSSRNNIASRVGTPSVNSGAPGPLNV